MLNNNCHKILKVLRKYPAAAGFAIQSKTGVEDQIADDLEHLAAEGYIILLSPLTDKDGVVPHFRRMYKILPKGTAYLDRIRQRTIDAWITRGIAGAALIVSIVALFK